MLEMMHAFDLRVIKVDFVGDILEILASQKVKLVADLLLDKATKSSYDLIVLPKQSLAHFLMSHNETRSKGEAVHGLESVVVKMSWRSTTNVDDCGVYTMRHMETFKGDPKWVCGLKKNDVATLEKLRLSYCGALVFFKGIVVSKMIIDRAQEFTKKKLQTA
ncbi:hypothetical protein RND81_08G064400 [Saponaria officinalis]|uniref:Ubiquitin-like protease family profile domain-containing protein n=1 Tax=Saponaria officinalis TaxID=3572 RepID=A0AAW1J5F6_SAPOF